MDLLMMLSASHNVGGDIEWVNFINWSLPCDLIYWEILEVKYIICDVEY